MGRIRDFLFGKDPVNLSENGEPVHDFHDHTWREWDERYAAKENDWHHHQGNYPLSHDLNFSVVEPTVHEGAKPDWRRADSDHGKNGEHRGDVK